MRVGIPEPLLGYTKQKQVEAEGKTVDDLLWDLDRRYPGIRFRMVDEQDRLRPHMRVFVNGEAVRDIEAPIDPGDRVQILQALSGG